MQNILQFATKIYEYEDDCKQEKVLSFLPLEQLYKEAEEMVKNGSKYSEEDCLIIRLLIWFKKWFQWVNAPPCDFCFSTEMENPHGEKPNLMEAQFGASVVEVWQCKKCQKTGRFPRYNDQIKLLEVRRGRCGEWSNAMQMILRSLGRVTRYIWNSEDHVWNEIWSEKEQRWIHIDSCEAAFDKPLTYTEGWGKKMAYVLAFSVVGAKDVSQRYIRPSNMQLPRTLLNEDELKTTLETMTAHMREQMDPVEQVEWFLRDEKEEAEFETYKDKKPTDTGDYLPRQSGSSEWVKSRGEDGRT